MESLRIRLEILDSDVGYVHLEGRMDIPGVQLVSLKFTVYTATRKKPVIVDLSQVEIITSMGIGMLISNANSLKLHAMPMILLNPQERVEEVLKLAHIDHILPIEHELASAIKRIQGIQRS